MTYAMIQGYPGKPPTPEVRVATAREVFRARYGREPAAICANAAQQTEGTTEAPAGVVPAGCVWCQVEGGEG